METRTSASPPPQPTWAKFSESTDMGTNGRLCSTPGDTGQALETFLVVTTGGGDATGICG